MPSKKQRRRREKAFRHEYDLVVLDEDGNETSLDPEERRLAREAKNKRTTAKPARGKSQSSARGGSRPIRVPPQASWQRALKRGGIMGALMLFAFVFFFKNGSLGGRIAIGVVYAAAFVPLTYWIDRTAYRSYEKRLAKRG
jgi:hypothetical protein